LLSKTEIDAAVAPYVGKNKDFSDVQRALEAVEDAYAKRGYSAVRVLLPEQELEKGTVRFRVVESHFGKVTVKDNHFVSEDQRAERDTFGAPGWCAAYQTDFARIETRQ